MMLGQLDVYIGKKNSPLHDVPKNRKINFEYFTELNVKVNILEKNTGELHDFDIRKDFLNRTKNTISITKISVKVFFKSKNMWLSKILFRE